MVPEFHSVLFYINTLLSVDSFIHVAKLTGDLVEARLREPLPVKNTSEPSDFITRFLHLREENPEKLAVEDIMISSLANIGAGSDTTSISITAVLYYISRDTTVLQKLRSELQEASARGEISSPITFKEAQQLKYLQAVIKESLRCHPATGLILGRVVPPAGAIVAGRSFPGGVCSGLFLEFTLVSADV